MWASLALCRDLTKGWNWIILGIGNIRMAIFATHTIRSRTILIMLVEETEYERYTVRCV